jgi:ribose transport system permease protein
MASDTVGQGGEGGPGAPVVDRPKAGSASRMVAGLLRRSDFSVVLATVVLFVIFAVGSESFLTQYNLFNMGRTAALYVFVAMGQAIVIVIGGMNLSLGAIGGLSVVMAGMAMQDWGLHPVLAFGVALGVGVAAGLTNGLIIVKLRLNSFVATLATSFIFVGLVNGISKGNPYTNIPKELTTIGRGDFFGFPVLFVLMLVLLTIVAYFFRFAVTGRRILATGGNAEAARLSGIRTDRITILANILSGMFAALAGYLWITRVGSAQPSIGSDWLIISFAVSIIGGTALAGGEISALGLGAAAVMLTLIKNGLIMFNVNVYYEQTFLGIVILLAVSLESFRAIGRRRRRNPRGAPVPKEG